MVIGGYANPRTVEHLEVTSACVRTEIQNPDFYDPKLLVTVLRQPLELSPWALTPYPIRDLHNCIVPPQVPATNRASEGGGKGEVVAYLNTPKAPSDTSRYRSPVALKKTLAPGKDSIVSQVKLGRGLDRSCCPLPGSSPTPQ